MLWLRRGAHLTLAIVLTFFAVAPHQHEGWAETFGRETVAQVGDCTAQTTHLHAARATTAHPCVACVRQHSSGTFRALVTPVSKPVITGFGSVAIARTAPPTLVFTPLRGPPASIV